MKISYRICFFMQEKKTEKKKKFQYSLNECLKYNEHMLPREIIRNIKER
jgi:hypothetical protein